ncbi:MAG TPA: hypothetical protein VH186_13690 [Chloroflexia bacterium]|nr:hypothetical protein [Chloroflexia bacterium]
MEDIGKSENGFKNTTWAKDRLFGFSLVVLFATFSASLVQF